MDRPLPRAYRGVLASRIELSGAGFGRVITCQPRTCPWRRCGPQRVPALGCLMCSTPPLTSSARWPTCWSTRCWSTVGGWCWMRETRKKLTAAVEAAEAAVTEGFGVGPIIAAIGGVHGVSRFASRDHFAACNGTARSCCEMARRYPLADPRPLTQTDMASGTGMAHRSANSARSCSR